MPEGSAEIEEISYMPVTAQWIPFDNIYENELFSKLVATKRSFSRPLRYNRAKGVSMPTVFLTDTGSSPTALYVITPGQDIEKVERESLELDYAKWFWDLKESATLPPLPLRSETREVASDYQRDSEETVKSALSPAAALSAAHPFLKNEKATVVQSSRSAAQRTPPGNISFANAETGTTDPSPDYAKLCACDPSRSGRLSTRRFNRRWGAAWNFRSTVCERGHADAL